MRAFIDGVARVMHRRPRLWAALLVSLPVALFYAPLLLGTHTFPKGDFTDHFLPFALFHADALRSLHLPVWNPHLYAGHPFLADTQAAVFYPISTLIEGATLWLGDAAARLYWLQIEAVVETMLAGGFVFLLVRALGADRWASVLGGLVFALSGYLTAYPPLQLAILRTVVWLPALLWILLRMAQSPRMWRWPLALVLAGTFTLFGGHPQTWLHGGYLAVAWTIFLFVSIGRTRGWAAGLRFLLLVAMAGLGALVLSAAQLLPSLEFTLLSVRASVDYAFVSGGFPLDDAWQLLLPGVLSLWSPLFVGVPALILAVSAFVLPVPAQFLLKHIVGWRAATWFFGVVMLIALLVSFGENGFLYPMVYEWLPGWRLFRGQERAALLVALPLSILAGMGAHLLASAPTRMRRALAIGGAGILVIAIAGYYIGWQRLGHTAIANPAYWRVAGLTFATVLLTVLLLWQAGWSFLRSAGVLLVAVGALFVANWGINLEAITPGERVAQSPEIVAVQQEVAAASSNGTLPGRVYNEYRVYEDYAMRADVEDLWGSSPLRLARYARFNEQFPLDRWWTLTGVGDVLTWRADLFEPSEVLGTFPQATDSTYLHRLTETSPRAWFVTGASVADDDTAFAFLGNHAFDLSTRAILPLESGAIDTQGEVLEAEVTARRIDNETLALDVSAPQAGLLVVAENWMPGWRIRSYGIGADDTTQIMGMPAFVPQRANLSFIAIPLPAGVHELTLAYEPDSVRYGLWISALALLLWAAVALWRLLLSPREKGEG